MYAWDEFMQVQLRVATEAQGIDKANMQVELQKRNNSRYQGLKGIAMDVLLGHMWMIQIQLILALVPRRCAKITKDRSSRKLVQKASMCQVSKDRHC